MIKNILVVIGFVLICGISTDLIAQNQTGDFQIKENLLPTPIDPLDCELAARYIDDVINRVVKVPDTTLIVLVRIGKDESSRTARKRIQDITIYLKNRGVSNFQIAEGEKTDGNRKFDFYVKGYLLYSLPVKKGETFDLRSCLAV